MYVYSVHLSCLHLFKHDVINQDYTRLTIPCCCYITYYTSDPGACPPAYSNQVPHIIMNEVAGYILIVDASMHDIL